jgi:hypothetical protein
VPTTRTSVTSPTTQSTTVTTIDDHGGLSNSGSGRGGHGADD